MKLANSKKTGRAPLKIIGALLSLLMLIGIATSLPGTAFMAVNAEGDGVDFTDYMFYANGIPVVIEARTDGVNGSCVKWTYGGVDYEQNMASSAYIFGGTESTDYTGNTSITMNGGRCSGILGGNAGTATTLTGNTRIVLNNGTAVNVSGGGFGNVTGNTYIEINGGDHGDIGGCSVYGQVTGDITITMNSGVASNISGGCEEGNSLGDIYININNGTVERQLYGASALSGDSSNSNINISVGGDSVINELIGGGGRGDAGNISIDIKDNATVTELLAAGIHGDVKGNIDVSVTDNASITLLNGTQESSGVVDGDIDISLLGNATAGEVNGSQNEQGVTGNVTITLGSDAEVAGNLTGASETTSVGGNVTLVVAKESAVKGEIIPAPEGVVAGEVAVKLSQTNDTEVIANASASYIIVIPELVDFGTVKRSDPIKTKDFYVRIEDALLDFGAKVTVDVTSDFAMKNEAAANHTLPYQLFNVAADGAALATGGRYCSFGMEAGDGVTEIGDDFAEQVDGRVTTNPGVLTRAGSYSDTMVFVCEYVAA